MKQMLFVMNPYAGMRKANKVLTEILEIFNRAGYLVHFYTTAASGDGERFVQEHAPGHDVVVCCGGDGTFNETVSGILKSGCDIPVGYIPAGSTNDFASSLRLSSDPVQAARDIVNGNARTFDAGLFNDIYFTYTATCGAFAKTSYSTPQAVKNALGHMAYVIEGVRDLTSIRPLRMRVETENRCIEEEFIFCSITNSTSVGGILKLDAELVALNDGMFEVTLVKNPTTPAQLSRILYGLTTQDIPNEMIYFFSASKIDITCEKPIEWTLDGERAPMADKVSLENLHNAIRLILPNKPRVQVPVLPEMMEDDEYTEEDQLSD